ncbi:fibronectin type III domain-containing protein [Flavobacterium branchiicola]|uniref:Fibronectin type III domain-containing protein n=1 Tax=Flavobacterium branchiicola TaxID=1114875 RepID=A0ABV9PMA6_9FLAO|nr:fibronectin type III domain-containing protein [Flavobacterium branchiicola]MBS7256167.1 fibronectin type III domain-containing protein [Flavobacterium branchiicola]
MKKLLLISVFICLPFFLIAQTTTTFTTAGTQTFVAPAGITSISVDAWGAGGAGGSSTNPGFSGARGGSGGGGGAFANATLGITSGASLTVVVGLGGKGVAGANGGAGGFSAITTYAIRADGGKGGIVNTGTPATVLGASGGTVAASTGTTRTPGGNGGDGESGITDESGALINSGAGGNAANGGGIGGAPITGAFVSNIGNNGNSPGGGGSGGKSSFVFPARKGGDGGDGKIVITFNCPTYSLDTTTATAVNVCSGSSSEVTVTGNLPIGLYSVSYEIQGVAQTPASMKVTTAGTGSFIATGFTTVGTKFIKITALTSGSSTNAAENCTSTINGNNTATVEVNSSGTAPVATAVSNETCTQITANWQAVAGAVYYEFDLSTDSAFGSFVTGYSALNVGNVLSLNITGLSTVTYYYRVRAFNGTCSSSNSNTITYTNPPAPTAPTGNNVTGNSCTQFTVNWNAVTNATSYTVQWSNDNFVNNILTAANLTTTTYTIIGLSTGNTYKYRVTAINRCGSGTYTSGNVVTANTLPGTISTIGGANNIFCDSFNARWTQTSSATSYLLDVYETVSGTFVLQNFDVGNVASYQVNNLVGGRGYSYRVKGKNGCGNSVNFSTVRTLTTSSAGPATPANVTVPAATLLCTGFTLSWNASSGTVDYTVQLSTTNAFPADATTQTITGITTTNTVFTGLISGSTYFYRVLARNGCGSSAYSATSSVIILAAPATPTITPVNTTICQTDGVTLAPVSPNAAYTYVWSTGETGPSIYVTSAGSYTVRAESAGGCSSAMSAAATVAIDNLPTAVAGGSQTICSNQPATVSGASFSNGTILWTFSGGAGTLTNPTSISPTFTPSLGGPARTIVLTMTVTSLASNKCAPQIATAKYTLNIQAAPTVSIAGSQTICSDGSMTVAAGEANAANGTILWTHDGTGTLTNATTLTPTYAAAVGDKGKQVTLTLTVTASPACSTAYVVSDIYPVVVLADNTAAAPSSTPSLCVNTLMTDITHETTTATGIGTPVSLPAGITASWASNTITISGTPSETGVFNYSIPLTGGCGIANATGTITVNLNTAGVASSSPTVCAHSAMTDITHTTTGATGIGVATGLPAGVTASWASNTITISGTPTVDGTFNYSIPLTGGCGAVAATGTITVNPLPATPNVGTITHPTCVNATGKIELISLLSVSNWTIIQTGTVSQTYSATNSDYTIDNLAPGTYSFSFQQGSDCPSLPTANIVIKAPVTNIWNGTAWSVGSAPLNTDSIEFAADFQSTGNITACSCKVDAGKTVTIKSGHTLRLDNELTVDPGAGTNMIFENNASLVQVNDVPNTGNITYKRNTTAVRRYDFTFWSSPVTRTPAFTLNNLSPNTLADKYYRYDPLNGWVIIYGGNAQMEEGKGYIIRAPQNFDINTPAVFNGSFIGVPNNGDVTFTVATAEKDYLIGNPYPSSVYADQFIVDNTNVLYGTLYFWTHNSPPSKAVAGDAIYNYTTDDYATYNLSGSVVVGSMQGQGAGTAGNQNPPSGYIAAGQSFFVTSKGTGNAIFNNQMRFDGNNSQFFKQSKTSKGLAELEKHRVWLNFTNTQGAFKQILVGYCEGATDKWDDNYDGKSYDGNKYVDFYSINESLNLTIQGRALPFNESDKVPLGYKSTIAGDFSISIDHADGSLSTQNIYLEDKKMNVIHDLRESNYLFTTAIGTFDDRFVLRYTNKTLGTVDIENLLDYVLFSVKDKIIKVTSSKEILKDIYIFDLSGKLIYSKNKIGETEIQITNLQSSNQVLMIKVVGDSGHSKTQKIIF